VIQKLKKNKTNLQSGSLLFHVVLQTQIGVLKRKESQNVKYKKETKRKKEKSTWSCRFKLNSSSSGRVLASARGVDGVRDLFIFRCGEEK